MHLHNCFLNKLKVPESRKLRYSMMYSRSKLPISTGSSKKPENSRKTSTSASFATLKPLTLWITENWKILRDGNTRSPYVQNLYAGQEATVRTGRGTMDWFKIRKGVRQGCILSPCLFNLYAEYVMWNAWLDEAQAGIKIVRRNISNLRYVEDTTLISESEEELKSLLIKVKKESEKVGLKLNIQKTKIMASAMVPSRHRK